MSNIINELLGMLPQITVYQGLSFEPLIVCMGRHGRLLDGPDKNNLATISLLF